jgi:hypothetical protein
MKETELQSSIIAYLLLQGHYIWRNNTGVVCSQYTRKDGVCKKRLWRAGKRGSSDIIGVAENGKFIAIECKIGRSKATEEQSQFIKDIQIHNGIGIIAYSLDDVINSGL